MDLLEFLVDISTLIQKTSQPKLVRPISIAFAIYLALSHTLACTSDLSIFHILNSFSNGSDITSVEWIPVNSWEYQ